ncbi:MAG: hypothetical protein ACRDL7_14505 [Gaiellaceae bacterium]
MEQAGAAADRLEKKPPSSWAAWAPLRKIPRSPKDERAADAAVFAA